MVDIWLVIVAIVVSVLLFISSFYIYVVYCHPDDAKLGTSLYYKIVVIAGMAVCWGLVLALPLDVANHR